MLQFAFPHISASILSYVAFEEVIYGTLIEESQILVRGVGCAVLQFHIVKEGIVLPADIRSGAYLSAYRDGETIVPESLRKLEGIVGVHVSGLVSAVLQTYRKVESAECRACNTIDFRL